MLPPARISARAVVAMSGGVDSSVAAALAQERGLNPVGVTLKLLPKLETGFGCCGAPSDIEDARRVCETLGIRHYVVDLNELFESAVISPFVSSYLSGRTPNPCVECNRAVKFGHLSALARAWGAESLATGHYARAEGGKLLKARDKAKDQSYFLYHLSPSELSGALFPVGDLLKEEVRAIARNLGLRTAEKPESQEICFVPKKDYRSFLRSRGAEPRPGPIRDRSGSVLGRHEGLANYTIGQRKGLGLSGGPARYVVGLEPGENAVLVGGEEEAKASTLKVSGLHWTSPEARSARRALVRIRHRHEPAPASLEPDGEGALQVRFDSPQRAACPGQAAVFYDGDWVLGGGTIESVSP